MSSKLHAKFVWIWPRSPAQAGVVAGTFAGRRILDRIPEKAFRRAVGAVVLLLDLYMLYRAFTL